MSLTQEDLQVLSDILEQKLEQKLEPIYARLDSADKDRQDMKDSLKELRDSHTRMEERLGIVEERLDNLDGRVQAVHESQVRIEQEQYPRITAALDRGAVEHDKNQEQDGRLGYLETKTDFHDVRLYALENPA